MVLFLDLLKSGSLELSRLQPIARRGVPRINRTVSNRFAQVSTVVSLEKMRNSYAFATAAENDGIDSRLSVKATLFQHSGGHHDSDKSKPRTLEQASLDESVGEFWFGEGAEVVVEGDFVGFLGAKSV